LFSLTIAAACSPRPHPSKGLIVNQCKMANDIAEVLTEATRNSVGCEVTAVGVVQGDTVTIELDNGDVYHAHVMAGPPAVHALDYTDTRERAKALVSWLGLGTMGNQRVTDALIAEYEIGYREGWYQ
jgi:hypothetical protein